MERLVSPPPVTPPFVTSIVAFDVFPSRVAVTVVVPAPTVVANPEASIVATPVLLDDHATWSVTSWFLEE